mmetsp:Transcript_39802/g.65162  ORF Transcript_39802/g.65162 Transcript_39802/m.65162 type:complete len:479 (+) Transcript_39802:186-1622(+)
MQAAAAASASAPAVDLDLSVTDGDIDDREHNHNSDAVSAVCTHRKRPRPKSQTTKNTCNKHGGHGHGMPAILDLTLSDSEPAVGGDNMPALPALETLPTTTTTTFPRLPTVAELDAQVRAQQQQAQPRRKRNCKSTRTRKRKRATKQETSDSESSEHEAAASTSSPPPRKKRKQASTPNKASKKMKKAAAEKRRARKRASSQKTRERISRARRQRLFMIDAKIVSEIEREYAVLGSTGNVYTVTIGTLHECTCPDFAKGNLCKHVLFVLLKVLRVDSSSEYVYQKALLSTELAEIFAAAPRTLFSSSVLANAAVRSKYKQSVGEDDEDVGEGEGEEEEEEATVERKPLEGDCPVCMDEIDGSEATTYCRARCGNNVHVECFNEWKGNALRAAQPVLCMFCRCEWQYEAGQREAKSVRHDHVVHRTDVHQNSNEGYLNLADEQGMSMRRDTSSYHRNGWNGYGSYATARYGRRGRYNRY